ncbi:MAG: hypothetical protein GXP01_01795, partial [Alphaproteobacteria bacterium]|nr:hypothetical protein [Alphaproteobacteria bacterium]
MANKPKPVSRDPETLAFSAVEDALHAGMNEGGPARPGQRTARGQSAKPSDRLLSAEKIARRTARTANEDRGLAGGLLYSLQSRSSAGPFWFALVASIVWAFGVLTLGSFRYGTSFSSSEAFVRFL